MNADAATKNAKPENTPVIPKAPRGAKSIAAVQGVMKTALDTFMARDGRGIAEDPVMLVIARWDAAHAALPVVPAELSYAASQKPQAAFDKAVDGLGKIERELARTTPTTAEGAAAALRFLLRAYGPDLDAVMDAPGVVRRVAEFLERQARQ